MNGSIKVALSPHQALLSIDYTILYYKEPWRGTSNKKRAISKLPQCIKFLVRLAMIVEAWAAK